MTTIYIVDVAWSNHTLLQAGVTERGWHRCAIAARSPAEAQLVAAQMVAATTGMPTRTRMVKEIND